MKCKTVNCKAEVDPMFKPWCYGCGTEIEALWPEKFYQETAEYHKKNEREREASD